jgi:HicB family
MTTLLIDDELGKQANQAAAAQGKTLNEFVREVLREAVKDNLISRTTRSGLPVMQVGSASPIDPEVVRRTLQEEGF